MSPISQLEGITVAEIGKLGAQRIETVEQLVALFNVGDADSLARLAERTKISQGRLIELVPTASVPVHTWPNEWIEELAVRLLQESKTEGTWWQRRREGLLGFKSGVQKSWISWGTNLPILILFAGLLCLLALGLRAEGMLGGLPQPLGLRDKILIAARDLKSGSTLRSGDLSEALLPSRDDYFPADAKLDGLVLARNISLQKPLRHEDVLRPQVVAVRDIQAGAPVEKDAVTLVWTPYQTGAALKLEEVTGRPAKQHFRKDSIILSEFIEQPK